MGSRPRAIVLLALVASGAVTAALEVQATPAQRTSAAARSQETHSTWPELVTAFEAERADWKARVRASKGARERSAARRADPTPRYAPAVEHMADAGEIRALFWLLDHLPDLGGRSAERKERRLALYERMIREHEGSNVLIGGMARMHADSRLARDQGLLTMERLTGDALATFASEVERDALRLGLAGCASRSRDPQSTAKAVALLDGILEAKRLPEDELEKASGLRYELLHLRLGCEAPSFEGRTIDGAPVRLADHRGKVVVLSFFGFW